MEGVIKKMFLILVLIKNVSALIGYDCGTRALNVTTLSLLDIGECDVKPPEVKVTKKYIVLLQINDFQHTKIYQCKITIDRTIMHCGMHSHSSIVHNGNAEYVKEISRESCLDLFRKRRLLIGDASAENVIDGIAINYTTTRPVTLAGTIRLDGACSGVSYSDPFGSWSNVIVSGKISISLHEEIVRVDVESDKIYLPSGTTCRLSDTSCIEASNGYTFWENLPLDPCGLRKFGLLFGGIANKISDISEKHTIYRIDSKEVSFGLSITREDFVCGRKVLRTEHPKLVIFETQPDQSFASTSKIETANLDLFTYINSKFVYLEKHVRTQMKQLYYDILRQQCKIEQEVLRNSLALATQSPDQFAYNLMRGPGYMAMIAGEVVHIMKCIPVEVRIEHSDECYTELRVNHRNSTYFLTPKTHILKARGTAIDCNPILSPQYKIDKLWYKVLHKPIATTDPAKIESQLQATWKYENPEHLAVSGIYSDKDLASIRNTMMFPVERPAVLNEFARELHGTTIGPKDSTILKLLNEETLERLVDSYWGRLWQRFMTFGTISAGVISLLMIVQMIKGLLEIILNGVALHRVYGFSIHLLGAIWNSLAHLLISLGTQLPEEPKTKKSSSHELKPLHPVDLEKGNDPEYATIKAGPYSLLSQEVKADLENEQPTAPSQPRGYFTLPK